MKQVVSVSFYALLMLLIVTSLVFASDIPFGSVTLVPGTTRSPLLFPFAVSDEIHVDYGEYLTLAVTPDGTLGPGDFVPIDLGNGIRREQVAGTVENVVSTGDQLLTSVGSKVGETHQGMDMRLVTTAYSDGNYQDWMAAGCPLDSRIIVIPVLEHYDGMGSRTVTVAGFTGFYIDDFVAGITFSGVFLPPPPGAVVTPEPSSTLSLISGILGFSALVWRRKK